MQVDSCSNEKGGGSPRLVPPASDQRRPLRVLVVDDHLLVRHTTRSQLQLISNLQVVGEAADGLEAVALARTLGPDLIMMDISMPGLDGIEATRRIKAEFPHICVIILSSHDGQTFYRRALDVGAAGYIVKGESPEGFSKAIHKILGAR